MSIRISVVVPTYRRPDLLQRCLTALAGQTLGLQAFEIIVVDDGDCERTRAVVQRFREGPLRDGNLRYTIAQHTQGPAAARNKGWRLARGDVVAFTDDDTIPTPSWLAQGLQAMEAPGATWAAVTGRVVVPVRGRPTDFELMTQGLQEAEFVTANLFVRRVVVEQIGGFDERFKRAWREDSELQFRLMRAGAAIGHAKDAVVLHPARTAPWGVSLRMQRNVFYDALLYKQYPDLYRARIRPTPPLRYYVIVLAALAAWASWLAGYPSAAAAALALALALSLEFAWQRLKPTTRAPAHVVEMTFTSLLIPFLSVYWRLAGALRFRVLFF